MCELDSMEAKENSGSPKSYYFNKISLSSNKPY